jgi:hypothetical protein
MRIVAEISPNQAHKAVDRGRGGDEQQQSQCDLTGHQHAMHAFTVRAPSGAARTGLHELSHLRAGELDRGSQTGQDTSENSHGTAECEDWDIDTNSHFMRKRKLRQPTNQEGKQTIGQAHTGQRAQ